MPTEEDIKTILRGNKDLAARNAKLVAELFTSPDSAIAAPVRSQKLGSHQSRQAAETPAEPQAGLNGGGKKRKYGNEPVEIDGIRFDSKKEAARWQDLLLLERAGEIQDLKRQVKFELGINGVVICHYVCDFAYIENGQQVIEDVKSTATKTRVYQIKKKLMRALYRIEIRET